MADEAPSTLTTQPAKEASSASGGLKEYTVVAGQSIRQIAEDGRRTEVTGGNKIRLTAHQATMFADMLEKA